MKQRPKIPALLYAMLLAIMMLPLAFTFVPQSRGPELYGIEKRHFAWKKATLKNIDGHVFQNEAEEAAKQNAGFCNWAVRLYNELNYKIFNYSNAPKLIIGKADCFYEDIYCNEYSGKDFSGDSVIQDNLLKLKHCQELLKSACGVDLLWVLAPGKVRYCPEFLPDGYGADPAAKTNYGRYVYYAKQLEVDYLNLGEYFASRKPVAEQPLYSRHGIHWSTYGMWLAADTMQHYIERRLQRALPGWHATGHHWSAENDELDFDLEPPMNLLSPLDHEQVYIPEMQFDTAEADSLPSALLIADSYAWSLWNKGIIAHWFNNPQFWYYNRTVYPDIWNPAVYADKRNLKDMVASHDVIILLMTQPNLRDFGWGFLDELLAVDWDVNRRPLF